MSGIGRNIGEIPMTDNVAVLAGYTVELFAKSEACSMPILVKPCTDLDGRFRAWDMDAQEFVFIHGWLWTFDQGEQP